jgi:Xaa-Pro dipeptidase
VDLAAIQEALREESLDGWLFFDHHRRDPLAYRILGLPDHGTVSRRWYYLIPAGGEPRGLVHRIEAGALDAVPGAKTAYSSWSEQSDGLAKLLAGCRTVAMQYSQRCAVPYVSMVDAGTVELVRSLGVEVRTSQNLVQYFEARWSQAQLEMHLEAGRRVDDIRRRAFAEIGERLRRGERVDEWAIAGVVRRGFAAEGLVTDHGPIVAVNANASNPHYEPSPEGSAEIRRGDNVLIDLWARLDHPDAVYYDITWTGYCGPAAPAAVEKVFEAVAGARDAAVARVEQAVAARRPLCGFEVDDAARGFLRERGLAEYFVHRTGHSIGRDVHGSGANMDNLETHDDRRVIARTCFSVEPGVYLPEFGIRSEVNVYVGETAARVTGEIQRKPVLIG